MPDFSLSCVCTILFVCFSNSFETRSHDLGGRLLVQCNSTCTSVISLRRKKTYIVACCWCFSSGSSSYQARVCHSSTPFLTHSCQLLLPGINCPFFSYSALMPTRRSATNVAVRLEQGQRDWDLSETTEKPSLCPIVESRWNLTDVSLARWTKWVEWSVDTSIIVGNVVTMIMRRKISAWMGKLFYYD